MKKVLLIIIIIVAAVFVTACVAGYVMYNRYQKDPTFMKGTTLNGESVEGETPAEVAERFAAIYDTDAIRVEIKENGEVSVSGTLKEFGYTYDKDTFEEFLEESYKEQREDIPSLIGSKMHGFQMTASDSYLYDTTAIEKIVRSDRLKEKRFETVDNTLVFDKEANRWHIEKGYIGNMIDDAALQAYTADILAKAVEEDEIPRLITIEIPPEVYISKEPAGDLEEMQKDCDARNLEIQKQEVLSSYKDASVTHLFGNVTELLTYDTFKDWMSIDDELNVTFDPESVSNYVDGLEYKYNTLYLDRTFVTTNGSTITIPARENCYGYTIDHDAEFAQLMSDLASKTQIVREPVYVDLDDYGIPFYYSRNGEDDLNGTYVEADLTLQHLWYYVNGNLVVESDFVSGSVEKKAETQTGCFPLAQKKSPETLTGDNADGSGSYSVDVKYWMPFFNGQGLHDASFRTAFGGDIYIKDGSHGCINLPFDAAETIYQNIEVGVPIIIYKS